MMATRHDPRYRIVVGLDLSEYSEVVLEHAFDQCTRQVGPDLHVVTVVDDPHADLEDIKQRLAAIVLPALDGFDCGDWHLRLHVRAGKPAEEIANLAAEIRAHLIVVGRFGLHGRRLAAVPSHVLELAPCPTLVVGLTDQSPDRMAQCAECVAIRMETDGERWFCEKHADGRASLASTVVPSSVFTGGSLMW
jgi:nucleotide-binding universal stress UspA family protein